MTIEIPADARPAGPEVAAEVVAAFTAAVVTTFQELTFTHVSLREPALVCASSASGDVNAIIELKRPLPGRLVCMFPQAILEALVQRYLPANVTLTPEIVGDTAGEFANVIAGQAKTMLKGTAFHYLLSTPLVCREPIAAKDSVGTGKHLLFLFDCDLGGFGVQVVLPPRP